MKKLMKKKVNMFGKEISVFALVMVAMIGLASAALMPYFGLITGNAIVSQGLNVDGKFYSTQDADLKIDEDFPTFTSLESKTFVSAHSLENNAGVDAEVNLVKSCLATGNSDGCNDITTEYYDLSYSVSAGDNYVMIFETVGTYNLTPNGEGYTGVLPMVDESTENLGDNIAGFDVYARGNVNASFGDKAGEVISWDEVEIIGNDAWSTWDPDIPDWYQYSISFDGNTWALRNHAGATVEDPWYADENIAKGVPMSGNINWNTMFATENDVGEYIDGTGTGEIPGGAKTKGGGANTWDMDWSWGSEMIPLESEGFNVKVEEIADGYRVTMTPIDLTSVISDPVTVPANGEVDFAIVNNFPKMLVPDTYTITTTVTA